MPPERFEKRWAETPFRHALPAIKTVLAVKLPAESARKLLGQRTDLETLVQWLETESQKTIGGTPPGRLYTGCQQPCMILKAM